VSVVVGFKRVLVQCDGCGHRVWLPGELGPELDKALGDRGWVFTMVEKDVNHCCYVCVKKERMKESRRHEYEKEKKIEKRRRRAAKSAS
jgi:hypothetical protein